MGAEQATALDSAAESGNLSDSDDYQANNLLYMTSIVPR